MPRTEEEATPPRQERARELLRLFARQLHARRMRMGLTQEDLAVRCGISVSYASLLERGERSPSYETLVRLADVLQTSLADLLADMAPEGTDEAPYRVRLLEFARRRRLTRAQVDQLLAVAEVMFADNVPPPAIVQAVEVCSREGCGRPVLARGLCMSHYHRARRARG